MKKGRLALLVLLAVACAGCRATGAGTPGIGRLEQWAKGDAASSAADSPLARLEVGMTAARVQEIAGPPVATETQGPDGGAEVWYYYGGVVALKGGRVVFSFARPAP